MPNIRTTHVSLLVDREVDRDVRTTHVSLLVDRETDTTLQLSELNLLANYPLNVDLEVSEIYLLVNYEAGAPWGNHFDQTDDFDYTLIASGVSRYWHDDAVNTDEFTSQHTAIRDTWIQTDTFQNLIIVRDWTDTQTQVDIFERIHVEAWSDAQTIADLYYNWPSIARTWQETWSQTSIVTSALQRLSFTSTQFQTDLWFNPGNVPATLTQAWTQTDTFRGYSDSQKWHDNQITSEAWDRSGDKVRAWSDILYQNDRWDTTHLADHWVQTDVFLQGATQVTVSHHWTQTGVFKLPYHLTLAQTWTPVEVWHTPTQSALLSQTWTPIENLQSYLRSEHFSDPWQHKDLFEAQHLYKDIEQHWEHNSNMRSLTQSVHFHDLHPDLEKVGGLTTLVGMFGWFEFALFPTREFSHTSNWHEAWRTVKPEENLELTQTQTDEFEANPLWADLVDVHNPSESWDQLSGFFLNDIFYQTATFTREHHARLPWADTWSSNQSFDQFKTPACTIPHGLFTLIDSTESLILRNARWGDTATIEQQRTIGITRSGTPFVGRRPVWPNREVFRYTIKPLSNDLLDQILDFFERNIGKQIWWIDHYGVRHRGFCLEPATPVVRRSKNRGEIQLTLVDLKGTTCDIIEHFQHVAEFTWQ